MPPLLDPPPAKAAERSSTGEGVAQIEPEAMYHRLPSVHPSRWRLQVGADGDGPASRGARPTRTERTRAATAVNRLGLELSALSPADLDQLELPERLRREIDVCQALGPRARGRQQRLIGQLLRADDHEQIRSRMETLKGVHRDWVQQEKRTERWLARILEEGDSAVEALIADYPGADRQRLRKLARSARQDPEGGSAKHAKQAKRARRELLRAIRELRS
jgi:ribosome-associated protein